MHASSHVADLLFLLGTFSLFLAGTLWMAVPPYTQCKTGGDQFPTPYRATLLKIFFITSLVLLVGALLVMCLGKKGDHRRERKKVLQ